MNVLAEIETCRLESNVIVCASRGASCGPGLSLGTMW